MAYTIRIFGTKPYDEASFNEKNKEFGVRTPIFQRSSEPTQRIADSGSGCRLHLCQRYRRCRK